MLRLDADPGNEPPLEDEDGGGGLETEDELAEDLTPSPNQASNIGTALPSPGPEDDEDDDGEGDGLETEDEIRSPRGRRALPA